MQTLLENAVWSNPGQQACIFRPIAKTVNGMLYLEGRRTPGVLVVTS